MQVLKMPEQVSEESPASLISTLLGKLESEAITYCHWKSNWQIERWLDGDGDLDVLVDRDDVGRFTNLLGRLGFKKALTGPEKDVPGIANFYGYDEDLQKFIHIHAHYQLVLGHDLTKNYRLPIEDAVLQSSIWRHNIKIASPEHEVILFVVRMVLKYSAPEELARKAARKLGSHLQQINRELDHLLSQADPARIRSELRRSFTMIEYDLFDRCLRSLTAGAGPLEKLRVRTRLERALASYSRSPWYLDRLLRLRRRTVWIGMRLLGRQARKKHLENGGALIAIVGGDGAGKTTCVNEMNRWLSRKFETNRVHLGKPPKSLSTMVAAAALRICRRAYRVAGSRSSDGGERQSFPIDFLHTLRLLLIARDRYRLHRKIRRLSARGSLVVCDRYPISGLQLMDGPKIESGAPAVGGSWVQLSSRIEQSYYRQIVPPDMMFVLRVDPLTAVERKTDEASTHVFPRSQELWNFKWIGTPACVIDAARPADEVLRELRTSIWRRL